mgnify:CR=1 FL=1
MALLTLFRFGGRSSISLTTVDGYAACSSVAVCSPITATDYFRNSSAMIKGRVGNSAAVLFMVYGHVYGWQWCWWG